MKKVNRNNSIRVLAAVLSTALIASMSGCNSKKKEVPSQNVEKELETLLDNSKRAHELEEILDLSNQVNEYLEEDNLLGQKKEAYNIEYYDYDIDREKYEYGVNVEGYTLDEMKQLTNNFKSLSEDDKEYFRAHLDTVLYYNNLFINYENFYRIILATATNSDYTSVLLEENLHLYIEDGKKLIKENKNKDITDVEVLMNHYRIDEKNAIYLYNLINTMPSTRFMVNEMNKDENDNFGSEDYIPELIDELSTSVKMLNSLNWEYYEYLKKLNNNSSKTKTRHL